MMVCTQSSVRKDMISSRDWCSYAARIAREVLCIVERGLGVAMLEDDRE